VPVPQWLELRTSREVLIAFPWRGVHPWPNSVSPSVPSPVSSPRAIAEVEVAEAVPEAPSLEQGDVAGGTTGEGAS
jgi:hypothetical protein